MIHDTINIILTLFVCQQLYYYIQNKETMKDTDTNKINDAYNKLMDLLKQLFLKNKDQDVVYNPLAPPEQRVESRQYPYPNNNWERTRGDPDDYQLYGRRIYPGAYEWEYYIRGKDAGGLDIKFPIQLNNKEEIRDGMVISLPIDKNQYTVSIYNYDQPRYNPFPNL